MATAPSPNDLTRQQLDELDALLQRMLSVPLAPVDTPLPAAAPPRGAEPPLPPSWRVDPPAPAAGASLPHIALPDPPPATLKFEAPAPALVPPPPAPAPKVAAPLPVPKPVAKAPAAPAPAPKPVLVPVPAPLPAAPAPAASLTPAPAAPPVPLPLVPLVLVNAAFDGLCGAFGPPGRLLRSGFFKHVYGLVGLGLLAYTAAHIGQTLNWLTLPVVLPWPQ